MASLEDLIIQFLQLSVYDEEERLEISRKICLFIINDSKISLLNLVEMLSKPLTDTKVENRAKGTSLLAEIMHQYPTGLMSIGEVDTFISFFTDRLKDHHTIQPIVLYGFLGLCSFQNISDENVVKILQVTFQEVHVQSMVQADRKNVFNLFNNLLKTKLNALKTYSADFLLGFIQAMDSERDPRNLVICFENSKLVLDNFDISIFEEDFFEVLSCYFPIEFTPPKDNPFNVTKEELVLGLRQCMTSTRHFAAYAIPLFLEKISSDIQESKREALVTFTKCLDIYSSKHVEIFLTDIWLQIRKEFLLTDNSELSHLFLQYIESLFKCLQKSKANDSIIGETDSSMEDPTANDDQDQKPTEKLVDLLVKDCLQTLKDPELTIARPCGDIICCISNISYESHHRISQSILPLIQNSLFKYTSAKQRENMLYMVMKLLSLHSVNKQCLDVLVKFVDQIVSLFYEILQCPQNLQLNIVCLQCLIEIVIKRDQFSSIDFKVLIKHALNPLLSRNTDSEMKKYYTRILQLINLHFTEVFDKEFMKKIECLTICDDIFKQSVECLLDCWKNESYFDDLLQFFINSIQKYEKKEDVLITVLDTLNQVIKVCNRKISNMKLLFFLQKIIVKFENMSSLVSCKLVEIIYYSYKQLNDIEQRDTLIYAFSLINENSISKFSYDCLLENDLLNTLGKEVMVNRMIVFITGILTQMKKDEVLKQINIEIFKNLLKYGAVLEDNCLKFAAVCAGTLVNKLSADKEELLHSLMVLLKEKKSQDEKQVAVVFSIWITKGLIMNWRKNTSDYIEMILEYLCDNEIGLLTASYFHNITSEDLFFTKESNCIVNLMHKQRFSQFTLPKIIEKYEKAETRGKAALITAISVMLQIAPKTMLQKYLKSLIPLLLQSISSEISSNILSSTLTTVLGILEINKTSAMEYVASFISRFLSVLSHQLMDIRILSLKCLYLTTFYPSHIIVPIKNEVISKLKPRLDDKKRLVRKEAVRTSNAWHVLNNSDK